jgi:site-specific DNA-methyltransferase (adenine-specific)
MEINKIYNGDILEMFGKTPDNFIDLIVTSPPYNVGIDYSDWNDKLPFDEYFEWVEKWLRECYRTLKPDGRIALNIPYEANFGDRGGRVFFTAEYYKVLQKVGFKFFGMVDLNEPASHRNKTSAWGSWMSASGPYINNAKECVLLGYKESHIKLNKGESQWSYEEVQVLDKVKKVYKQEDKDEFMKLVFAEWDYFADTRSLTTATFSEDIPSKAIKIMTYKDDLVLDCFSGSGTTAVSAIKLGRNYIGFEISPEYHKISLKRIKDLETLRKVEQTSKQFFDFDK